MKKSVLAGILVLIVPLILFPQTHPRDFLGHEVGADKKLADYDQITAYFQKLESETPRLKLLTIGETTLGKPIHSPSRFLASFMSVSANLCVLKYQML